MKIVATVHSDIVHTMFDAVVQKYWDDDFAESWDDGLIDINITADLTESHCTWFKNSCSNEDFQKLHEYVTELKMIGYENKFY